MKKTLSLFLGLSMLFFASCSDDDDPETPTQDIPQEVITDVILTLTEVGTDDTVVFRASTGDAGFEEGATFNNQTGVLKADTSYDTSIEILNSLEDPAEDITEEIEELDDEHQLFYIPSENAGISTVYGDFDGAGNPLGLTTTLTTTTLGENLTLRIVLRHEPVKGAEGVSDGDITNADGESDFDLIFEINR